MTYTFDFTGLGAQKRYQGILTIDDAPDDFDIGDYLRFDPAARILELDDPRHPTLRVFVNREQLECWTVKPR